MKESKKCAEKPFFAFFDTIGLTKTKKQGQG